VESHKGLVILSVLGVAATFAGADDGAGPVSMEMVIEPYFVPSPHVKFIGGFAFALVT
jgi:hypothetical protein